MVRLAQLASGYRSLGVFTLPLANVFVRAVTGAAALET